MNVYKSYVDSIYSSSKESHTVCTKGDSIIHTIYLTAPTPIQITIETDTNADATLIARYAPELNNKYDTREKKDEKKNKPRQRQALPIHSPAILGQEFFTRSLERIVRPQVPDAHRLSGERINTGLFHVLDNAATVKAGARGSHNRIMHDLKRDSVNEPVGYNLIPILAPSPSQNVQEPQEYSPAPESLPWTKS